MSGKYYQSQKSPMSGGSDHQLDLLFKTDLSSSRRESSKCGRSNGSRLFLLFLLFLLLLLLLLFFVFICFFEKTRNSDIVIARLLVSFEVRHFQLWFVMLILSFKDSTLNRCLKVKRFKQSFKKLLGNYSEL